MNYLRVIPYTCLLSLLLISCSNSEKGNKLKGINAPLEVKLSGIKVLKETSLPDEIKVQNNFIGAKKWSDKNGVLLEFV